MGLQKQENATLKEFEYAKFMRPQNCLCLILCYDGTRDNSDLISNGTVLDSSLLPCENDFVFLPRRVLHQLIVEDAFVHQLAVIAISSKREIKQVCIEHQIA